MNIVETPPTPARLDLTSSKWIGYALAAVGSITPIPIIFVAQPVLGVLALISILFQALLLVLIFVMPQAFLVSAPRLSAPIINFALIIPVISLILAGADAHFVEPRVTTVIAVVVGLAGMLGATLAPRAVYIPNPIFYVVFVAAVAGGLGWGATSLADRAFDLSDGQPYQAEVQFKSRTYGRNNGYHLTLAPWGPIGQSTTIGVSSAVYDKVSERSPICILLHRGALGLAWYDVEAC